MVAQPVEYTDEKRFNPSNRCIPYRIGLRNCLGGVWLRNGRFRPDDYQPHDPRGLL